MGACWSSSAALNAWDTSVDALAGASQHGSSRSGGSGDAALRSLAATSHDCSILLQTHSSFDNNNSHKGEVVRSSVGLKGGRKKMRSISTVVVDGAVEGRSFSFQLPLRKAHSLEAAVERSANSGCCLQAFAAFAPLHKAQIAERAAGLCLELFGFAAAAVIREPELGRRPRKELHHPHLRSSGTLLEPTSPHLLACAGSEWSPCEVSSLCPAVQKAVAAGCFAPDGRPLGVALLLEAPLEGDAWYGPAVRSGVAAPLIAPNGSRCGSL